MCLKREAKWDGGPGAMQSSGARLWPWAVGAWGLCTGPQVCASSQNHIGLGFGGWAGGAFMLALCLPSLSGVMKRRSQR